MFFFAVLFLPFISFFCLAFEFLKEKEKSKNERKEEKK
jgi:hypothetical protein